MPSAPKKDRGFARCPKCAHQGRWIVCCEPCKGGSNFKKKAYLMSDKQRILDGFQQENIVVKGKIDIDASDEFKQIINSFQQQIPPAIVSTGNLTNCVLSLLMLGFPLHYKKISEILGASEGSVNVILNRFVKDDNIPVLKEIDSNGRIKKGRYMVDPGIRIELELLDKPLKFHNVRLYPGIPRAIYQQYVWEGSIFSTLIKHLPAISIPRGNARVWKYDFLSREVSFVADGKRFWVELSTSNEALDISLLWEFIKWVADKFGNDTYRYNWEMAYEPNQDLTGLQIAGGGLVEVFVAGKLYRAYQKFANDDRGSPILRVEQGRMESDTVTVISSGMIDKDVISETLKKHGTLQAGLDKQKEAMKEMKDQKEEMEKLLNLITDSTLSNWTNPEFINDVKEMMKTNQGIIPKLEVMMGERKLLYESFSQIAINQKVIIETQKIILKAIGIKPEDTIESVDLSEIYDMNIQ